MSRPCRGCGDPLSPDLVAIGARTCGSCAALLQGIDAPESTPAPETEEARRERFHAARVEAVKASWIRGRRCLLARALEADASDPSWSRPQPR
jgi:hypothetical protein